MASRSAARLKPARTEVGPQSSVNRAEQLSKLAQPLPLWLQTEFSQLVARLHDDRLPHGLLLHGVEGIGKHIFAAHLCAALFCERVVAGRLSAHCSECQSCQQYLGGNHPDYLYVQRTEDERTKKLSSMIRVTDVRVANQWAQLTAQSSAKKVVLVDSAEIMNGNAANALLKTLEEPPAGTILILLANNIANLPATIVSRCQQTRLRVTDREQARQWVEEAGVADAAAALRITAEAPFRAAELFSGDANEKRQRLFNTFSNISRGKASIARSVEQLADIEAHDFLPLLMSWTADILKCRAGAAQQCRNLDLVNELSSLSQQTETVSWFTIYDQLLQLHRIDSASFKSQPVLESIFAAIRLQASTP